MCQVQQQDTTRSFFLQVLENGAVKTVFQPIISLRDGSVFGYEALSRGPQNTSMESPQALFDCAMKYNRLWDLEMLCRSKAIETVHSQAADIKLFININANIMHDSDYSQGMTKDYLKRYQMNSENIIFEISEKEAIHNLDDFKNAVKNYKGQDFKIAVDDAGAGYSGLNLISDVHPHFIKLDMNLIRDVHKDTVKQALLRSMCEFAALSNTYLVAEGIETKEELLKLIDIGIHYGQGYFIQKPNPAILPVTSELCTLITEANSRKNHLLGSRITDIYIQNICIPHQTLNGNIKVSQVVDMINADPSIPGYCITEHDTLVGVITRNGLLMKTSGMYGYSVFSKEPIKSIMSREFLCVDHKTPIDIVGKIAMQRTHDKIYDFITVTQDNRYYGIVTVKELLEKTIQIEIINAKHLNPLSELPGNVLIEQELEKSIEIGASTTILYFDIDNFKAYNDVYGFEKGDQVIKTLAQTIRALTPPKDFVGHIGGDDFIAVLETIDDGELNSLCQRVLNTFHQSIPQFYHEEDCKKGFIIAKNRHGTEESYPLLTLSIAGVKSRAFKSIYALSEKASELKKQCKQQNGSICILE